MAGQAAQPHCCPGTPPGPSLQGGSGERGNVCVCVFVCARTGGALTFVPHLTNRGRMRPQAEKASRKCRDRKQRMLMRRV